MAKYKIMAEYLPLFKALHVVGFVAWFAGLFYLVRIFVYHEEAMDMPEPEKQILTKQFNLMEWRVYNIICKPAVYITWTFGSLMISAYGWQWFTLSPWLHVKLLFVTGLTGYVVYTKTIIEKMERGERPFTSYQLRLLNEVPTVFLLAISLLAVYKNGLNALYAILGIIAFGIALMIGTKFYKRIRERNS